MRIRNFVSSLAVAALLSGCANQTPIGADPVGAPASATPPVAPAWVEPENYKFTLTSSCGERELFGRFRAAVTDGMVVKNEGLDASARRAVMLRLSRLVPTLGQLKARAETARKQGTSDVVVDVDPVDGHPTSIIIGTEACYQISDYSVG